MKRAPEQMLALAWIVSSLLLSLSGCGSSTNNPDAVGDSASAAKLDAAVPVDSSNVPLGADAASTPPDARATDTTTAQADTLAPDTTLVRADTVAPDTGRVAGDAAIPDAVVRADTTPTDGASPRADATVPGDTSPRDVLAPDTQVKGPDATASRCNLDGGPATLVRLTPQELKAILDSSENPYLINVKGTSIANIPGTDAVLASDVPGIEKLVGGDLCADIILYCKSGGTSQSVASQLIAKGYQRVRDLAGGIGAWTDAGYPTE